MTSPMADRLALAYEGANTLSSIVPEGSKNMKDRLLRKAEKKLGARVQKIRAEVRNTWVTEILLTKPGKL